MLIAVRLGDDVFNSFAEMGGEGTGEKWKGGGGDETYAPTRQIYFGSDLAANEARAPAPALKFDY